MFYEINNDIKTRYRLIKYYFPGHVQSINLLFFCTNYLSVCTWPDVCFVRVDLHYKTNNGSLKIMQTFLTIYKPGLRLFLADNCSISTK